MIRDGCLGDNISAVNRQEPLSRLTYIVSKVGRGSRRLYWNGTTDGLAGRCARPGQARRIFARRRYIKRQQSSRDFLLFVCCFGAARRMLIHSIDGESNNTSERRMPYRCQAYGERCWKKRNEEKPSRQSGVFWYFPQNHRVRENKKQKKQKWNLLFS